MSDDIAVNGASAPATNGAPPEDVLSQINELFNDFQEYVKKVKPKLNGDKALLDKFETEADKVIMAHGPALNRKDPEHLRKVIRTAKPIIDKLVSADSDEFTETETAQEAGNSADVIEDVHQEDDPGEDLVEHDKRENPEDYWPVCENGKHRKNPEWAEQPCPKCLPPLPGRPSEQVDRDAPEPESDEGSSEVDQLAKYAPEPEADWDEVAEPFLEPLSEGNLELALREGEKTLAAIREVVEDDWPFDDPNEFGPLLTTQERKQLGTAKDPILSTVDKERCVIAHKRRTALHGPPGGGKTWLSWLTGRTAISGAGRVVVLNHEEGTLDGTASFLERFEALDPNHESWWDSVRVIPPDLFTSPAQLQRARNLAIDWLQAADNKNHSLVIIDSVTAAGGAVNDANEFNIWVQEHVKPWWDAGIGVLLVAHEPKNGESPGLLGTTAGTAYFDTVLRVHCRPGQAPWTSETVGEVTVAVTKDRKSDSGKGRGQPVAVIHGEPRNGQLTLTVNDPDPKAFEDPPKRDLKAAIIKLIKDQPEQTWIGATALYRKLGCSPNDGGVAVNELVDAGEISKDKDGRKDRFIVIISQNPRDNE